MPRSWKSHGISGILKFSGISGKVKIQLMCMSIKRSWNFVIRSWKSHGILSRQFRDNPEERKILLTVEKREWGLYFQILFLNFFSESMEQFNMQGLCYCKQNFIPFGKWGVIFARGGCLSNTGDSAKNRIWGSWTMTLPDIKKSWQKPNCFIACCNRSYYISFEFVILSFNVRERSVTFSFVSTWLAFSRRSN